MAEFLPLNGTELQAALNAAVGGDFIRLRKGTVYSRAGSFTFPEKVGITDYITVTTDSPEVLPAKLDNYPTNWLYDDYSSYRITTAEAAQMPKIVGIDSGFVIQFPNRSNYWKLYGIEITGSNNVFFQTMISVAGYEPTLADFNHHLFFDHLFIHPQEEDGHPMTGMPYRHGEYAILIGGNDHVIQNCAVQGFAGYLPATSQPLNAYAILYGLGTGNVLIQNNLLETSGNVLWTGGGGGGFPFPDSQTTITAGATATSLTLTSMPADPVVVDDRISVRVQALSDFLITGVGDPDALNPTPAVLGWSVGKVTNVSGLDVTLDSLTSSIDFRMFRILFKSGTSNGTFTLTINGETSSAITFPSIGITGASNTTPIEITTSTAHGFSTNDEVRITEVGGNTNANKNYIITVTASNKFTLNGSAGNGTYTSGGKVANRTVLQSTVQAAIEGLPSIVPADLSYVSAYQLYVGGWSNYYPAANTGLQFGVEVAFVRSWPNLMRAGTDVTVNGASLTGSGNVGVRVEVVVSEGYSILHPDIGPDAGAVIAWDGLVPDNVTIQQNIIAKQPVWAPYQNKGFGEVKSNKGTLFEGNIWYGLPTGMILETKNQGGDAPWSVVSNQTFRYNLWTHAGSPIAIAPTDGANRSLQGHTYYIHDNVCLGAPSGAYDPAFWGNATVGGENIRIEHNTFMNPGRFVFAVVGTTYDGPEVAGWSQLRQWVFRNNICRYSYQFWGGFNATPGVAPLYNHGNIIDYLPDFAADNNVIIDDRGYYVAYGDFFSFFAVHTDNNYRIADFSDVGFLNTGIDETTFIDPRLDSSSIYAAGNARDASDNKDMGADIPALIVAMGFNPFASTVVNTYSGNITFSGSVVI